MSHRYPISKQSIVNNLSPFYNIAIILVASPSIATAINLTPSQVVKIPAMTSSIEENLNHAHMPISFTNSASLSVTATENEEQITIKLITATSSIQGKTILFWIKNIIEFKFQF